MATATERGDAVAPPFDTFIFDLDGTLLDTLDDLVVLTNDVLAEVGMPPRTRAEINSFVGNGGLALIRQAVPAGTPDAVADEVHERWKAAYDAYPNDLTHPYPGVEVMLAELRKRGCKLGILSNKFDGGVQFIVKKCLPGAVDTAHGEGGPQHFPRKPDPAGLLATIEELGSEPARTVYVGDSPGDVHVARNAGCYAVGVTWGYHDPTDFAAEGWPPDLLANDPAQIVALVPEGR